FICAASSTTLLLTTTAAPAMRPATSSGRVWSYSRHSGKLCVRPVKSISAGRRVPVSRNTPFMDYSEFSFAPPSRLDAWLNSLRLGHADDKPRIAVSACLTGQPVRYDGGDRYDGTVARVLRRWLLLQEYCPEIAIGLGVPRAPIQVLRTADGLRVRGVTDSGQDVTHALRGFADTLPASLSGAVLKARSPSCGVDNTPVWNEQGEQIDTASGAFAARLVERAPLLPMISETALAHAEQVELFVLQAYCYRQQQRWGAGEWLATVRDTVASWSVAGVRDPLLGYLARLAH